MKLLRFIVKQNINSYFSNTTKGIAISGILDKIKIIFGSNDTVNSFIHENSSGMRNVPQLDGLRGVAILLVILIHLWSNSSVNGTGFPIVITANNYIFELTRILSAADWGVYIFFVLSGFLLYLSFATAIQEDRKLPSIRRFYLRRIFRIMPAFLFVFSLYLVLFFILGPSPYSSLVNFFTVFSNILFLNPLVRWLIPSWPIDIIPGTWSLTPEIYFYLILPVIALISKSYKQLALPLILCGLVIGPIWRHFFLPPYNFLIYLPMHLDIFFFGMLAAWIYIKYKNTPKVSTIYTIGGIIGVILFIYTWVVPRQDFFIVDIRFQIGLSCFLILLGALVYIPVMSEILVSPVIRFIGVVSFSAFLINDMVFWYVMEPLFKFLSITDDHTRFWMLICLGIPIIFLLSTFFYCYVEKPFLEKEFDVKTCFTSVSYAYIISFIGILSIGFFSFFFTGGLYK